MAYDVATGRLRVGLAATDASQDPAILAATNAALAFAEHYCDRNFLYKREKLTKAYDRDYEGVFVNHYPVSQVHSVTGASGSAVANGSYEVHGSAGLVFLGNRGLYMRGHNLFNSAQKVTIDYEGGYKALPADLEFALWAMFDAVWPTFDPSVSGGGGGVSTVAIGSVKKRTIVGVGSVEYETGGSSGSNSSGGAVAADWSAVMPGAVQAILDLYARKVA